MNGLRIFINNKEYEVIGTIDLDDKHYMAYSDKDNMYVSEYIATKQNVVLHQVSQEIVEKVLKELDIDYSN